MEIPNGKRVQYSLQYIHGIGRTRALQILNDLKMENKITKDLSEEELIILRDEVSKYMIEGDLVILLSPSPTHTVDIYVFVLNMFCTCRIVQIEMKQIDLVSM